MSMILAVCGILVCATDAADRDVLIVHDDPAPMAILAEALEEKGRFTVVSVVQDKLPDDLSRFAAVFNFVHKPMKDRAVRGCI